MRRIPILVVSAVAGGVLLASCGGSDEPELSKSAFIKKVDAICAGASQQVASGTGDVAATMASTLNTEADEIDSLNGPSSDADRIEAIVDSTQGIVDAIEADSQDNNKIGVQIVKTEELAEAYGLESCPIS